MKEKCVGCDAFYGCRNLTEIDIPQSVTSIGNLAFAYCMTLETIVSYAQIPPVCGNNTFQGVDKSNCIVRVALSKVDAYKAADTWGEFVNIQAASFVWHPEIFYFRVLFESRK